MMAPKGENIRIARSNISVLRRTCSSIASKAGKGVGHLIAELLLLAG